MAKDALTLIKEAVKTDSRGRLVLGDRFKDKQYSVHVNTDGEILLTPVVVIPAKEAWLFKNKSGVKSAQKEVSITGTTSLFKKAGNNS